MPSQTRTGLIAKKMGMTRVFGANGEHIPVTVLSIGEAQTVVAQRTEEKDGYVAVQLGAFSQKPQRLSKAVRTYFEKSNAQPKAKLAEFRVKAENLLAAGTELKADHFTPGQMVDITGTTKGRGFTGAMKRWGFGGGRATHGNSVSHRSLGGTGGRQDPGRVFKNKKMHGHYGDETVTTQNLEVVRVDAEQGLILVRGSVPGGKQGYVMVRDAVKAKSTKA